MGNFITQIARGVLARAGFIAVKQKTYRDLVARAVEAPRRIAALAPVFRDERRQAIDALADAQSQLGQDIFVLETCGWKRGGWFVEFGATDGKTLNNTWLLEKQFGWTGILAEPARCWHKALMASGRTAKIDTACVWTRTGEVLQFHETDWQEVSTIGAFAGDDMHDRSGAKKYDVTTISFNDLLEKHGAPAEMDYLSIDTEGSELDILTSLDFTRYRFKVITCEHNFTPRREAIHALLTSHGYVRQREDLSQFDDWYVLAG